jgi:hypothetical protein
MAYALVREACPDVSVFCGGSGKAKVLQESIRVVLIFHTDEDTAVAAGIFCFPNDKTTRFLEHGDHAEVIVNSTEGHF